MAYAPGEDFYSMIEQAENKDASFKLSPMKIVMEIIGVGLFMIPVIAPYQCWQISHG